MAGAIALECVLVFLALSPPIIFGNYTDTPWVHQCDPGSEIFACTVPNFLYNPKRNHSSLAVPATGGKVRLAYPRDKVLLRDNILAYDAVLHAALHRPRAVQIENTLIKTVNLPVDLEYADFRDNSIEIFIAPEVNGSAYALRYLDLRLNRLTTIVELRTLVRLETLLLAYNRISAVDGTVLRCFPKLTGLHLGGNQLDSFPFADLPASLEWLVLSLNELRTLPDLAGMYTPALQSLNLEDNYITNFDLAPLLTAAPNLKELLLRSDYTTIEDAAELTHKLLEAGIVHDRFAANREADTEYEEDVIELYHRTKQLHEAREHIFSGLLVLVNVCVMAWGGHRLYRARCEQECREVRQA
uniref:Leucine rich immune protein (Coil-less) n=1 Tax=Anopheles epiroticus TaxID=199890 RepID=A0A182P8Y8_9DIPT